MTRTSIEPEDDWGSRSLLAGVLLALLGIAVILVDIRGQLRVLAEVARPSVKAVKGKP